MTEALLWVCKAKDTGLSLLLAPSGWEGQPASMSHSYSSTPNYHAFLSHILNLYILKSPTLSHKQCSLRVAHIFIALFAFYFSDTIIEKFFVE